MTLGLPSAHSSASRGPQFFQSPSLNLTSSTAGTWSVIPPISASLPCPFPLPKRHNMEDDPCSVCSRELISTVSTVSLQWLLNLLCSTLCHPQASLIPA